MYIFMNSIYLRLQKALTLIGLSSLISGYGWGAYGWVFKKYKFDCHSVVEDLEYTLKLPLKVVFIDDATVFDENPPSLYLLLSKGCVGTGAIFIMPLEKKVL